MAITKQEKIETVEKLKKAIKSASSLVFVNFHGLTVADVMKLRKALRDKAVGYVVAKKTLIKRALSEEKIEGEIPTLDGEVALAYGSELTPASEIYNFHKDHKDVLKIIGGVFEGKFLDADKMLSLATIPSKEVLIAQFVNLINSPIARFAVVLGQIEKQKEGQVTS